MNPVYPPSWSSRRVVLAHDWLTGMRGGERVLELLGEGFPHAPIYTLLANPAAVSASIRRHPVFTSFLQKVPGIHRHYRAFLPLFPAAVRTLRPSRADLVISTTHCAVKAVRAPDTPHLCYCFTPMRYAWLFYEEYFGANPLKALLVKPLLAWLRRWDRRTAGRVDRFVAISEHVRDRIRRCYGREADVVYPPVNTAYWTPDPTVPREDFDLIVSALVPYKRVDLAVQAYARSGRRLKIVGSGGQLAPLRAAAPANVDVLGRLTDAEILALYRRARLLVFPGEEDFGIVPLEAQACGLPVAAYRRGGATETVADGRTGCFFDTQTPEALNEAVERARTMDWDPAVLRAHAERFDAQHFIDGIDRSIRQVLG